MDSFAGRRKVARRSSLCVACDGAAHAGMSPMLSFWLAVLVVFLGPLARGQQDNSDSIWVESNLVLVRASVYNGYMFLRDPPGSDECRDQQEAYFNKLSPSEAYLPKSCPGFFEVNDLTVHDFHLFEDGREQKIESLRIEPRSGIVVRDNLGVHAEWSHNPRAKWSESDFQIKPGDHEGWWFAAASRYVISFVPEDSERGKCHHIKVTVDRPHSYVYASDQYCFVEHPVADPLRGSELGNKMENWLKSIGAGQIPLVMRANVLSPAPKSARVDLALEIPWDHLKFGWTCGDLHAAIAVMGIAYRGDGSTAARFSDSAYDGSERRMGGGFLHEYCQRINFDEYDSGTLPSRYQAQMELAPGTYELVVLLSDGVNYGRARSTLRVEDYDAGQLGLSSLVLSDRVRNAEAAAKEAQAANLAPEYVPLVSKGVQVSPAAGSRFKRSEPFIAYFEVYEPLLSESPPAKVQVRMRVVDTKTGKPAGGFEPFDAAPYEEPGSTVIRIGKGLQVDKLPKGKYRLEVQARDSAGRRTWVRTADFTLE